MNFVLVYNLERFIVQLEKPMPDLKWKSEIQRIISINGKYDNCIKKVQFKIKIHPHNIINFFKYLLNKAIGIRT